MRINLVTPFAEKDAAKALGARWDAARKVWYIVDVQDLTPFLRWIQNAEDGGDNSVALAKRKPAKAAPRPSEKVAVTNLPAMAVAHCGCAALPWEDCIHTRGA